MEETILGTRDAKNQAQSFCVQRWSLVFLQHGKLRPNLPCLSPGRDMEGTCVMNKLLQDPSQGQNQRQEIWKTRTWHHGLDLQKSFYKQNQVKLQGIEKLGFEQFPPAMTTSFQA